MIRAHELARRLLAGPNGIVATWDGSSDVDVEEIIQVPGTCGETVVLLGMEICGTVLEGSETVWAQDDGRAEALDTARAKLARARLESAQEAQAEEMRQ
jgi:hypothetical protein